jgi:hypothetical protein
VPNSDSVQAVSSSDIQRLFRGGRRVRITGDVSKIRFYGYQGEYRREVYVLHSFGESIT